MYLVVTASKDTYITDKIIKNAYSASDGNMGQAATLDLFRLWGESRLTGVTTTNELSRALIHFNLDDLYALTSSILDITDSSFECFLEMSDIMGGHATPTNFNLLLFPLSQSFDEGTGRDVSTFGDLDACNFITASYSNGAAVTWYATGANAAGNVSAATPSYPTNIDIIESADFNDGNGSQLVTVKQTFTKGSEDLSMNITQIVSATMAGILPDCGFRISFSGSEETDEKTRFVKRFASRHTSNPFKRPKLVVTWDDTIQDKHRNSYFDLTGSIFLKSYHRGASSNIVSGSGLTEVSGDSCMKVDLVTGSYTKTIDVSQYKIGSVAQAGIYTASFCIPSSDGSTVIENDTIAMFAYKSGSLVFDEYWRSTDGNVGYHTGSIKLSRIERTSFDTTSRDMDMWITNMSTVYKKSDIVTFRVFVRDHKEESKAFKKPIKLKSLVLDEVYYRIKDSDTGEIVIPFKKDNNGSRLSTDSGGMFFDFRMSALHTGRTYVFDFLIKDRGVEVIVEDRRSRFSVDA